MYRIIELPSHGAELGLECVNILLVGEHQLLQGDNLLLVVSNLINNSMVKYVFVLESVNILLLGEHQLLQVDNLLLLVINLIQNSMVQHFVVL